MIWEELLRRGYNPDEPRDDHGRWTTDVDTPKENPYPDAIEPTYPIETALTFLTGGEAFAAIKELKASWEAGSSVVEGMTTAAESSKITEAAKSIEEFLGGEGKIIKNPNGNIVIMRGDKKVRFYIGDPGEDIEHFHLQRETVNGKWRDAGTQHRYYFSK